MRKIKKIIVHCSNSPFGCYRLIDKWHKERIPPFDSFGYNYLILNGYPFSTKEHITILDGHIEPGRPESMIGAHCFGYNKNSIGICLIGLPGEFTNAQKVSFKALSKSIMHRFGLSASDIYGHNEFNANKTCPGITTNELRNLIRGQL